MESVGIMLGLAPHTGIVFDKICQLECIKPYILVGGTALSLQIGNRQSEDLDFIKWRTSKSENYACPRYSPLVQPVLIQDNLSAADLLSIGAMKMEVMMRRSKFRDYYDIYSLLQEGVDFHAMVDLALKYSGHLLHSKNLYAMLTNGARFSEDTNFTQLQPKYDITSKDIEDYLRRLILEA